ncbi:MAG TPA: HEAT repeat domain-containing protein [Candidatus Binatia bacterium]|jgi:hypothetical protein
MRRLIWLLGLLSIAAIVALVVYPRSFSNLSSREDSSKTAAVIKESDKSSGRTSTPASGPIEHAPPQEPAWLAEARNDPDPRVRLNAIETWARNPGESLDPVTHALVDPDESVRARAQELFEEALARR